MTHSPRPRAMASRLLALVALLCAPAALAAPRLYIAAEAVAQPGGDASFEVRARSQGGPAEVHIWRVGQPLELLRLVGDARRVTFETTAVREELTAAAKDSKEPSKRFGLEHVRTFQTTIPSGYQTHKVTFAAKRAGLYVVEVDLDGQAAYGLVTVSRLAVVTKRTEADFLAYVTDRFTGVPIPGVQVAVLGGSKVLGVGKTDSDGTWLTALPFRPELRVVALSGDDVDAGLTEHFPASAPVPRVFVVTDRPLYKAGETVYFKGFARVPGPDGLAPPPANPPPAMIEVTDGHNAVAAKVSAPVSPDGTFSGELTIPGDAAYGKWRLVATVAGGKHAAELKVEDFAKPPFEVKVTPLKRHVVGGNDVAVEIRAAFYAGGKLGKAPVSWKVHASRFDRPSWLGLEHSDYLGGHEAKVFKSRIVKQGEGTLDADGSLTIELPTEKTDHDLVYRFEVAVTGPSGRLVAGGGSASVTRAAFRIATRATPLVVEAGKVATIAVGARDYGGKPVQTAVTVEVQLLDTSLEPKGPAAGGSVLRRLHHEVVQTDADGVAQVRFTPSVGGHLQVVARAEDEGGNKIDAVTYLWAASGSEAVTLRADGLRIVTDRTVYQPGDTARVVLVTPNENGHVLVTREGARLFGHEVVRSKGNVAVLALRLTGDQSPNVFLGAAGVHDGKVRVAQRQLIVEPTHRKLAVSLSMDREGYRTRDEGKLTIQTTDAGGKPVAAELAVSIVDEALYALSERLEPGMLPFFYPRQRNGVGTATTARSGWYGYGVDTPRVKREEKPEAKKDAKTAMAFDEEAPAAEAMMLAAPRARAPASPKKKAKNGDDEPSAEEAREDLRTTLVFLPTVMTGPDGRVVVPVMFSDDLTTWRISAFGASTSGRVGQAKAQVRVSQELMVRLDAPAHWTEGDEVTVSAVVTNLSEASQTVAVALEATGLERAKGAEPKTVMLGAGASEAVHFDLRATAPGTASVTVSATAGELKDAVKHSVTVGAWGTPDVARAVIDLRSEGADGSAKLTLPAKVVAGSPRLTVRVASGPAAAIRDALPYLTGYPYGCVEQTMNTFLPLLVARNALQQLEGGESGLPPDVEGMVARGVSRLLTLQRDDGSWGWISRRNRDALMSAYALVGLAWARELGAAVSEVSIGRAVESLKKNLAEDDIPYATRALTAYALTIASPGDDSRNLALQLFDTLDRAKAHGFTQAVVALTLHRLKRPEAKDAIKDLVASAKREGDVLWWEGGGPLPAGDTVEATGWALRAIAKVAPDHEAIAPAVWYLLRERRGDRWRSTRDSGAAVLGLTEVLASQGAQGEPAKVTVIAGGKPLGEVTVNPRSLSDAGATLELGADALKPGATVPVTVEKAGGGLAIAEVSLTWMTAEARPKPRIEGLTVTREYYVLQAPELGKEAYRRVPLARATPRQGDVVEVVVEVAATELGARYVLLEDPLPAGAERVRDIRSFPVEGHDWTIPAEDARQDREDRTAFLYRQLPGQITNARYLIRLQRPATTLRVAPAVATLMYRPAKLGRSAGTTLAVGRSLP